MKYGDEKGAKCTAILAMNFENKDAKYADEVFF